MTDPVTTAMLAETCWRRYLRDHSPADRNEAIRLYDIVLEHRAELVPRQVRDALIAAYEPDTDDVAARAEYAAELISVVRRIDEPALLDRAVGLLQAVVADSAPDDPRRPAYWSDLGLVLQLRHRRRGAPEDLDEAVDCARRAVLTAAADDRNLPAMRSNLAAALIGRFRRGGDPADLREAADMAQAATTTRDGDDPGLALSTLSEVWRLRALRLGDASALDEAIATGWAALAGTAEDQRRFAPRASQLTVALLDRFDRRGGAADLDEAVGLLRRAVQSCDDPLDRSRLSLNLSTALHTRFLRTGEPADIDEAVETAAAALRGAAGDEVATVATDLGAALLTRFEATRNLADVAEAMRLSRVAVDNTSAQHPAWPGRVVNLGNALRRRFEVAGDGADLDEAVEVLRRAADAAGGDLRVLYNLAVVLRIRFEHSHRPADLDESINRCRAADQAAAPGRPARAAILSALGAALAHRDPPAADAAWREAAGLASARGRTRIGAALAWASAAARRHDWASASDGYAVAVALLPVFASRAVRRSARETLLRGSAGAALDAAAAAVNVGRPVHAAGLLEQGRAVLWTQMLDGRTDLGEVSAVAPALAARLAAVGAALEPESGRMFGPNRSPGFRPGSAPDLMAS
ncbi:hypothetical protein Dvina_17370 [Dactylosporangium vinaceum]|uniref:Uncharacterized protein n=1 Tax=Dactylosporangium vinaceum TaxID=53362 RepID=A0ABV5M3V7_9ACTN|nr:hypothetical protein [Dactylosporangium vinaceum]UAB99680.1 hypothetical protein Dvina_17370 [Dactylosporangium vinaceum]